MELFDRIIRAVDANLIYCLIPMILTLILIERLFEGRFPTNKALRLSSWIIISYTAIILLHFVTEIIFYPEEAALIDRAIGTYKIAHWIMLLAALIFPITLLNKKLASKYWYVLMVAFLMKAGIYFERFVIIVTSIRRNNTPENRSLDFLNSWTYSLFIIFLQGFLLTILTLGILRLIEKRKTVNIVV